jgi:hypothetical protein
MLDPRTGPGVVSPGKGTQVFRPLRREASDPSSAATADLAGRGGRP